MIEWIDDGTLRIKGREQACSWDLNDVSKARLLARFAGENRVEIVLAEERLSPSRKHSTRININRDEAIALIKVLASLL